VDRFLIDQARERIRDAYKASGYFVTDVSIDEAALERDRRLVLIVREGPWIRVREIAFAGNTAFPDKALRKQIEAKAWFPVFGQNRVLDREQLQLDASRLQDYYKDRGYLVAQVDRQIDVSPDEKDALVTFVIDEGPRWTLGGVRVESDDGEPLIFTDEQIRLCTGGWVIWRCAWCGAATAGRAWTACSTARRARWTWWCGSTRGRRRT